MVCYEYDKSELTILETKMESDYEFCFQIFDEQVLRRLKQLRAEVENNDDLTDVHFVTKLDHQYLAGVRHNFRLEFILLLFKYGIINAISRNQE